MLQRVQLLLDTQSKIDLEELADLEDASMSAVVRKLVKKEKQGKKNAIKRAKKKLSGAQALLAMAKAAEEIDRKYGFEGPTDGSINHDYYLYGLPKRKP